jgi:Uma2 family endonuclease
MGRVDPKFRDAYTSSVVLAAGVGVDDDEPKEDHFVYLHGVLWSDYERLLKIRGEHSVPRLAYEKGVVELMSPSDEHESLTFWISRLTEVWCDEHDIDFSGLGNWTLKSKRNEGGVEPDACYIFGARRSRVEGRRPDLAIEIVWKSGGIDKRDLYRKFGVPELWFWRRGRISVHVLRPRGYQAVERSELLPGIDLDELVSFLDRPTTSRAMREYRAALQKKKRA